MSVVHFDAIGRRGGPMLAIVVAIACTLSAGRAWAVADCTALASGVAFGVYDPLAAAPDDSTASMTVVCAYVSGGTDQVGYRVSLSTGDSGTYSARTMHAGSSALNYNLYSDAGRTAVWGDGSNGTTVMSDSFTVGPGVGNSLRIDTRTIYGRMPARQDALDGSYADTIVVTLEF
jgi:spore coat protein U-like protein